MSYSMDYEGDGMSMDTDVKARGYAYVEMDITGEMFWVEDTLALASTTFEVAPMLDIDLSAEMGMDMQMNMADSNSDEYYYEEDDYYYGEEEYYGDEDEYYEDDVYDDDYYGGFENMEGGIEADLAVKTTDAGMSFGTTYDPPLDMFDFPIYDGETWESCSDVTTEYRSASGKITYDVHVKPWGDFGDMMDMEEMDMSVTEDLGSSFETSSATEEVCYSFFADFDPEGAPSGLEDLWEITGEEDFYEDGGFYEDEDSIAALSGLGLLGIADSTDLAGFDPVSSMAGSVNFYDPDQKFFVASGMDEIGQLESLDSLGALAGTDTGSPLDYTDDTMISQSTTSAAVTSYSDGGRQAQRDRADAALDEMEVAEEEGLDARWAYIATFAVIIVALLAIAFMWSRRRKKAAGDRAGPPGAPQAMPAPAPQPAPYAPPGQMHATGPPPTAPPASPPSQPYPQQSHPAPASQPPQPQSWGGGGLPPQAPPQARPAQPVQQGPQQQQGWNDYN
jgi:hypothetical protein